MEESLFSLVVTTLMILGCLAIAIKQVSSAARSFLELTAPQREREILFLVASVFLMYATWFSFQSCHASQGQGPLCIVTIPVTWIFNTFVRIWNGFVFWGWYDPIGQLVCNYMALASVLLAAGLVIYYASIGAYRAGSVAVSVTRKLINKTD